MLLKQIRYFTSVVDCNSFTEAAEQCYISQSAISQQIQALEKELGVELIHRENRHFHLTPAGEYFYKHGQDLLRDAEELKKETIKIGQDDEQQLRIGYLPHYSSQELHQSIADFTLLYPDVDVHIVGGTHEELYGMLRSGEIDIALSDQRRAFSEEYINYQLLYVKCYVEVSIRNKLSSSQKLSIRELRKTPCILIASKEQQDKEQDYYQNTLGFQGNFLFAENLDEARLMVVGGRGFLPVESVGTMPPPLPNVCRLPLYREEKHLEKNYCAFWKKERTNYYIEEFAEILHKRISS